MNFKRNPVVERIYLRVKNIKDWLLTRLIGLLLYFLKKLPAKRSTRIAEKLFKSLALPVAT